MSRLTFKPHDRSYWDDKLIIPHPSETPDGYQFLFTQSLENFRISLNEDMSRESKVSYTEVDIYARVVNADI